jgi:membrane fusion protein, type I secretion system
MTAGPDASGHDTGAMGARRAHWIDHRPAVLGGIVVIVLVLGGLTGWAATAPLASAVIAPGTIVVDGKRKQVQHLEGGVVESIHVGDGAQVQAGELLIRLDEARARATLGVQRAALDAARILEARLIAERDGSEVMRYPDQLAARRHEATLTEMMHAQEALIAARRASFLGQQSIFRQRIAQTEREITGLEAQQMALEQQIEFAEQELVGLRELFQKNLVPITKVLALEREAARLKGSRGERIADAARAHIAIGKTELEILQAEHEFREKVLKEIRDVQAQIADLEERISAARSTLDHIDIRAPVAGTVVGLNAFTVGGVIKAGETILEIVPAAQRLIVETQVQPTDIDNVAAGMNTELRLTAFKQRMTPTLHGRLIYVSADRLTDQRSGQPYYLARAEIPESELARIAPLTLQPGMPVEILIKKRERTALAYLFQPILDAMGRAWRED